jgi:hypothetical protein
MLGGIATVTKALRPDITVVAAEPTGKMNQQMQSVLGVSLLVCHVRPSHQAYAPSIPARGSGVHTVQATTMPPMWRGASQLGSSRAAPSQTPLRMAFEVCVPMPSSAQPLVT